MITTVSSKKGFIHIKMQFSVVHFFQNFLFIIHSLIQGLECISNVNEALKQFLKEFIQHKTIELKHEFFLLGTKVSWVVKFQGSNLAQDYYSMIHTQKKQRQITKICDWAKYDYRLQFKKYMTYQTVILPKWFSHEGIILTKEQFHHSHTF